VKKYLKTQYPPYGVGSKNYVRHPRRLFKGWRHLHRWFYASNLLKSVKINSDVDCRWCMKNSRSTSIWSITAGNNVPSTYGRFAFDCVDVDAL